MALSSCLSFFVSFFTSSAGSTTPLSMSSTDSDALTTCTAQPSGASAPASSTVTLLAVASVPMSTMNGWMAAISASSSQRMYTSAAVLWARPADARSDRAAPMSSRACSICASSASMRHVDHAAADGYSATMIDTGSGLPAVIGRPRPGRRCHSSSVTKGIIGCSSFRPWSRHTYSTLRASSFASASSPYMVGLMSSRYTSHSSCSQKL
mmetsp:Transcript_19217/g.67847  ORF Transcript_19217/g.67847 Transcript_19217/m.67847 type:complete len:209 (-) Transcript_19217:2741-3367(-)